MLVVVPVVERDGIRQQSRRAGAALARIRLADQQALAALDEVLDRFALLLEVLERGLRFRPLGRQEQHVDILEAGGPELLPRHRGHLKLQPFQPIDGGLLALVDPRHQNANGAIGLGFGLVG